MEPQEFFQTAIAKCEEMLDTLNNATQSVSELIIKLEELRDTTGATDDNTYNICPKCNSEMEVDEEYMQEHYGAALCDGLIAEKDILYWCLLCDEGYIRGERL